MDFAKASGFHFATAGLEMAPKSPPLIGDFRLTHSGDELD